MKKVLATFLITTLATPAYAQVATETVGASTAPVTQTLSCAGPAATKKYAGNFWLVSACSDGKSLAFVASEGNPARPFTLTRVTQDNGITYTANGTGDKAAADAALAEIKTLDDAAIAALIAEAKGAK